MKKILILGLLSIVMILFPLLTACNSNTSETSTKAATTTKTTQTAASSTTAASSSAATTAVKADWWDSFGEPEYGGTITLREASLTIDLDPGSSYGGLYVYSGDYLWVPDWTVDRNTWKFNTQYVPQEYWNGCLAESWETINPTTIRVYLRQGIHWQDKEPTNGREFTAEDVQFHYDRILGTGNGFTQISGFWGGRLKNIEKVTAVDTYTVDFTFKAAGYLNFLTIADLKGMNWVEAPEWYALGESGMKDWTNLTGTGPWIIQELVSGSSATFERNPDYWGYDERYPDNQLPYADELKILQIADSATALAALRTNKIDVMTSVQWQDQQTLASSSTDLEQAALPSAGQGVALRVDNAPFTDIKVRKALQMSLNREAIAVSHYNGTVDGVPCGVITPEISGYATPFEDWPAALQEEYSYNPDKAKELLAEAGYPDGFSTNVVMRSDGDTQLAQIFKSYFADIGVDMEIKLMDGPSAMAFAFARKHDQMWWQGNACGRTFVIADSLISYVSGEIANYGCVVDPTYDKLYSDFIGCSSEQEARELCIEADMRTLEEHWTILTFPTATYNIWYPSLKGYSGEYLLGAYYARLWKE